MPTRRENVVQDRRSIDVWTFQRDGSNCDSLQMRKGGGSSGVPLNRRRISFLPNWQSSSRLFPLPPLFKSDTCRRYGRFWYALSTISGTSSSFARWEGSLVFSSPASENVGVRPKRREAPATHREMESLREGDADRARYPDRSAFSRSFPPDGCLRTAAFRSPVIRSSAKYPKSNPNDSPSTTGSRSVRTFPVRGRQKS